MDGIFTHSRKHVRTHARSLARSFRCKLCDVMLCYSIRYHLIQLSFHELECFSTKSTKHVSKFKIVYLTAFRHLFVRKGCSNMSRRCAEHFLFTGWLTRAFDLFHFYKLTSRLMDLLSN